MSSSSLEPEYTLFAFDEEPNVQIGFDESYLIKFIKGTRKDGSFVDNTDIKNPYSKKPITLVMQQKLPNELRQEYGFKIPAAYDKVARFMAVTEALVDMATTEGSWGKPLEGDEIWAKKDLGNYNNLIKFFFIADQVGFYSLKDKQRKSYEIKKTEDDKQAFQVEQFSQNPLVGQWLGRKYDPESPDAMPDGYVMKTPKFKDKPQDAITLWQALILLDMTPEQFLAGQVSGTPIENNADKINALTDRLEEKTFHAVGDELEAFPQPMSLITWATRTSVPINTQLENPKTKKMEIVPFAQRRSPAFEEGSGGVQKQLTKFLRHFAESNGLTGTWSQLWSQKTPDSKHSLIELDIHYLKDFEDCLRKGVQFDNKGEFVIFEKAKKEKENVWFNAKNKKHKDGDPKPAFEMEYELGKYKTIEAGATYYPVKKVITTREDWEAAWMYYRVAMDLGWRAEEGFTAGANQSLNDDMTGTKETHTPKTKENPEGQKFILLRIMTRKTAHIGKGHHGGAIITPETMDLIRKKRALVDEYSDPDKHSPEEALKKGVIQTYISRAVDPTTLLIEGEKVSGLPPTYGKPVKNEIHALVGADGYFTEVDTMDLPSNPLMSKALKKTYREHNLQIPAVKPIQRNRIKLHAIMRHCYAEIFADKPDMYDDYFTGHSLHALRHLFAQYWLTASSIKNGGVRDYSLVMKMGHWKGVDVLMNFYGGESNVKITKRAMELRTSYEDLAEREKIQKEEDKANKPLEEELENVDEDNFTESTSDETDDAGEPDANLTEEEQTDEL